MAEKSKIELIRDFIQTCPYLKNGKVNVDYIKDKAQSYSIDETASTTILARFADGGTRNQILFDFSIQANFSVLENIKNSKFCDDFTNWIKEQEKIKFEDINFNNGKVIHNKEKNRIQFLFNNIPDEEYRKILKQHGFHWSRMEKAWQREFNLNCIKATNIVLEEFNEMQKEGEEFE